MKNGRESHQVVSLETNKFAILASDAQMERTRIVLDLNACGVDSSIDKLLIVNREFMPGRTTMILVKENLGF